MILSKQILFIGVITAIALTVGWLMSSSDYNIQGLALIILFLSILVPFVVVPRVAAGEGELFSKFILFAFVLKMSASVFRMLWGFDVKGGHIDAGRYHRTGEQLALSIWHMEFAPVRTYLSSQGTRFVEGITGVIYSITGPTLYGGFLIFATFAFLGSCFYYKAFRVAMPEGSRWVYAGMVFLYPSWLYWPSSTGKDAAIALLIGCFSYGAALFLRQRPLRGLVFIAIGLAGAFMIRPHIAGLMGVALGIAFVFRPLKFDLLAVSTRVAVVAFAVLMVWIVVGRAASFLKIDELTAENTLNTYEIIQGRASGGSYFEPISITEPLGIPKAIITTLYRPFPWEAHRGAALVLSLEGVFFLALTIWKFGNIKSAILSAHSDPFVLFILVYSALCIVAFTAFGNFSILGRQRLQFLPLFFMLLAYPTASAKKKVAVATNGRQEPMLPSEQRLVSPSTNNARSP